MMHRLTIKLGGLALLTSGLAVAGALLIGALAYVPASIAADLGESDGCVLPCWFGLSPSDTPRSAINPALEDAGYTFNFDRTMRLGTSLVYEPSILGQCTFYVYMAERSFSAATLRDCPKTTLGDIVAILGDPVGLVPGQALIFRGGSVTAHWSLRCRGRVTPHTPVEQVTLTASEALLPTWGRILYWPGFGGNVDC